MLKLLKLAVLLGLVAGVLFLVPVNGRTLYGRWRTASGAADFAARAWAELQGAEPPASPVPPATPRRRPGKASAAAEPPSAKDRPLDTTTDADRKALDKLLDQQLTEKPRR